MTKSHFAISITSQDRVGIVYDVARRISVRHGNIADLSQTVLRGYFTMILLASFPAGVTAVDIEQSLTEINQTDGPPIKVGVLPVTDPAVVHEEVDPANVYVLTALGDDRIGFVATVAAFCAEHTINILDLATTVQEGQYTMMLQVDLSRAASLPTLQRSLKQFAQQHAIRMVLQHNDIFQATHEINMPG